MSGAEQALATLLDYVQRTHRREEGGATRHDALLALGVLGADVATPYKPQVNPPKCWACNDTQAAASRATARIAIEHLQAVVRTGPVPVEDFNARCRALDWLTSICSEPR